jgi:hypothetical protein
MTAVMLLLLLLDGMGILIQKLIWKNPREFFLLEIDLR